MEKLKCVVLASSFKHGGKCIAVKDFFTKKWFRIVYDEKGCAVPCEKTKFNNNLSENSYSLVPLKVVSIPICKKSPILGQPENIILGEGRIEQVEPFVIKDVDVSDFIDSPDDLWGKGYCVPDVSASTVEQSLYLIKPENVKLETESNPFDNKIKRTVYFSYNMINYKLPCTDPKFDSLRKKKDFHVQALCISLGENYDGNHYKIVASIL